MDFRAIVMGLSFALMWSSAFTSARIAVAYASPLAMLSLRFLISGLIAVIIARALGQTARLTRDQWVAVVLFGICQNAIYLGANFMAMQWIEASLAAIIASLLPLFVAAASWIFLGERLSKVGVIGLIAGTVGVFIIMGARLSGGADLFGVVLCFIGVAALTIATLLVRKISTSGNVLMIVGLQMLVGSAVLLPSSLLLETFHVEWTWQLLLAFAYTTLIPGLAATLIWFLLVGRVGATRSASFHFLNPFLGVAIAALVISEALTLRDFLGVIIIMMGVFAVQTAQSRKGTKAA
ncbi:EamA family transporter [Rhodobacterales bacterium 52_120_T64]|nr:EamA family transporter [Rhodobacterales bacterium 52_120_T64]